MRQGPSPDRAARRSGRVRDAGRHVNQLLWLGLLLLAWATFLLVAARPAHVRARELAQWMRGRGLDPRHILGVSYVASPAGLRALRVVGAVVGAAGVALLVAGALRRVP
jgi:hypothetical protein